MAIRRIFRLTMKNIFYTLVALFSIGIYAQDKVLTKTGQISFEASVPSFEEVKGTLSNAGSAINTKTGDIACVLMIKSFKFKNGLMQEHFNENYMESDKYPKSVFTGKIENFNFSELSSKAVKYTVTGTIEIHGKKKSISVPVMIKKNDKTTNVTSSFELKPEEFDIEIPSIVGYKIAKTVTVKMNLDLN
jgi:polyisoprenoid-binding protein YceI